MAAHHPTEPVPTDLRAAGMGHESGSHAQGRTAGVGIESGPLLSRLTTETFEAGFSASWGADLRDLCAALQL